MKTLTTHRMSVSGHHFIEDRDAGQWQGRHPSCRQMWTFPIGGPASELQPFAEHEMERIAEKHQNHYLSIIIVSPMKVTRRAAIKKLSGRWEAVSE